jgi:hypothetical protein
VTTLAGLMFVADTVTEMLEAVELFAKEVITAVRGAAAGEPSQKNPTVTLGERRNPEKPREG